VLPIRFGLTDPETTYLNTQVREQLSYLVQGKPVPKKELKAIPQRLMLPTNVDVTLWLNGKLQGSIVLTDVPLIQGVKQAAVIAAGDSRFKPLAPEEVPNVDVEITIFDTLKMPLTETERTQGLIYTDKTYSLETNNQIGWYIPAVFNCKGFRSLNELASELCVEKLGQDRISGTPKISETINFISHHHTPQRTTRLSGPLPVINNPLSLSELQQAGVVYLARIQEPDGNIPTVLDPLRGNHFLFDPVRLTHCCCALLYFGEQSALAKEAGLRSFNYLHNLFKRQSYLKYLHPYQKILSATYLHQAATIANESPLIELLEEEIIDLHNKIPYEPILYTQLAKFFYAKGIVEEGDYHMEAVLTDFYRRQSEGHSIELAAYSDLIPVLAQKAAMTDDVAIREQSARLLEWFQNQRLSNGAFPARTDSRYTYSRGTAKILESLSSQSTLPTPPETLTWLTSLQYSKDTRYFVSPNLQDVVVGSFRHDAHNPAIWTDTISHLLLIKKTA
jgi:AMMECR1 domain-containing protein